MIKLGTAELPNALRHCEKLPRLRQEPNLLPTVSALTVKRVSECMRGGIQEATRSVRGEEEYAKEKTLFPAAILHSPILTSTPSLSTLPLG